MLTPFCGLSLDPLASTSERVFASVIWSVLLLAITSGCNRSSSPENIPSSSTLLESGVSSENPPPVHVPVRNYHHRDEYERLARLGDWPALAGPYQNFSGVFVGNEPSEGKTRPKQEWAERIREPVWSQQTGTGISVPIVSGDRIYLFHRQGDEEMVDCRNLQTGRLIWRFGSPTRFSSPASFTNGPCSTPAINEHSIYSLGTEAKLYCLSRETGEVEQMRDLQLDYAPKSNGIPPAGSLLLQQDAVIVNIGGTKNESALIAIQCKTGATVWHQLQDEGCISTPRYARFHSRSFILATTKHHFWGLDLQTGEPRWKYEFTTRDTPDSLYATFPAVAGNRIVLAGGKDVDLVCLEVQEKGTPKEIWKTKGKQRRYQSNMLVLDDSLILAQEGDSGQTELISISLKDGKTNWNKPLNLSRPTLLLLHDELILLGRKGNLAVWKMVLRESWPIYQPVYQTESTLLEEPCRTIPIVAQGKLILRNERKLLAIQIDE